MTGDLDLCVAADVDEPVSLGTSVRPHFKRLSDAVVTLIRLRNPYVHFDWSKMEMAVDPEVAMMLGSTPEIVDWVVVGARHGFPSAQAAFENPFRLPTHIYGWRIRFAFDPADRPAPGAIRFTLPSLFDDGVTAVEAFVL